jgi:hypothetical protein
VEAIMAEKNFKTVLLLGLPASGKSEIREFINNNNQQHITTLHFGENLQLDDFPYVHFFSRIDEKLVKCGQKRVFYSEQDPFIDDRDWGTLVNLLNDDYHLLKEKKKIITEEPVTYLFDRIQKASEKVGIKRDLFDYTDDVFNNIVCGLTEDAKKIISSNNAQCDLDLEDKTLVIEMARGGQDGATMPLTGAKGYQYSLPWLDEEILKDATILYVWVTPEESRRKNADRCDPNDPGSNLHHGVSIRVMLNDYGCDDMIYLRDNSDKKDTVKVTKDGKDYYLPIGVFDNRDDKTTFLRADHTTWKQEDIDTIANGLKSATDTMYQVKEELEK